MMGDFFVTSVSNGEEDGTISIDRENSIYISGIDFNVTSQLPKDADPNIQSEMRSSIFEVRRSPHYEIWCGRSQIQQ